MCRNSVLVLLLTIILSACSSSKMSVISDRQVLVQPVSRLAIAPGSGLLGEALAVELFNSGIPVVSAIEALTIIERVGLKELEFTSARGYAALRAAGISAVIAAKSVFGADGTPENASVRITSTMSGETVAGITWQNGWGGQRGSIADRSMRKNLSEAAREIAGELRNRVRIVR